MAIKKDHSKILGVDYDPQQDMQLDVKPDGDCDVKYKGQKIDYMTYVDEIDERIIVFAQILQVLGVRGFAVT